MRFKKLSLAECSLRVVATSSSTGHRATKTLHTAQALRRTSQNKVYCLNAPGARCIDTSDRKTWTGQESRLASVIAELLDYYIADYSVCVCVYIHIYIYIILLVKLVLLVLLLLLLLLYYGRLCYATSYSVAP